MHKDLSCTLSRLSSSEPVAIVPVSGCLPGLHTIHLHWFRTRMIDLTEHDQANIPANVLELPSRDQCSSARSALPSTKWVSKAAALNSPVQEPSVRSGRQPRKQITPSRICVTMQVVDFL